MQRIMRVGALAALTVAGVVGFTGSASADGVATINLHIRYCAEGAVNVFEDCHDNPVEGLEVWVENDQGTEAESQMSDEQGNASFEVSGGDYYSWNYDDAPAGTPLWPDEYVTSYCSVDGGDGSDIEPKGDRADIDNWDWFIDVAADDVVTCDVYFWNWDMDPIHGGAETPNTGAGPMTTGTSAGFFLAGAVALGGLAVASRKRAFR